MVDSFSKFVEGDVLPNKTAKSIALFLWKHLFCRYLAPLECVVHDRDRTLGAKIMKELLKNFDCDIKVTVGGNPQSNGQAEIFIKTIKERINAVLCDLSNVTIFHIYLVFSEIYELTYKKTKQILKYNKNNMF